MLFGMRFERTFLYSRRVVMEIKQDAATIKKAMVQINALAGSHSAQDVNQWCVCTDPPRRRAPARPPPGTDGRPPRSTRWIMTKEDHCDKIIKTTSEYMLAQRVKSASFKNKADYAEALIAHHGLLQAAMKAKQTVDVAHCDALDHAIEDVGAMYLKH